jgi:prephenate dehydrogenase
MNIAIIGLGLIGGSIAKAIKLNTNYLVFGSDLDQSVVLKAKMLDAIDAELDENALSSCQMLILALHPVAAENWLQQNAGKLPEGMLVIDCCGTKRSISQLGEALAEKYSFDFIGGHPMAGIERSGFEASSEKLFEKASMILCPPAKVKLEKLNFAKQFFLKLGFGRITISSPEEHDRVIAYTSQLAHIVSSSYMKSPTAERHAGFSAGSFRDMTRVAELNENMWNELFLQNDDFLSEEITLLINNLQAFNNAIKEKNKEALLELLIEGKKQKRKIDELELKHR